MAYTPWSVVFGEQPSAAKWNILGANDASFADGTGIDDGAITAAKLATPPSRYVQLNPAVQVVDLDPTSTAAVGVNVTANTSATTFAVVLNVGISSSTTVGRSVFVRATGSGAANNNLTRAVQNQNSSGTKNWNQVTCLVDASQSFDWLVDNADVNTLTIVLMGYYETVA